MKTILTALLALLIVACAASGGSPARAQARARDPGEMLARADLNGDGQITHAEFLQSRGRIFERMDRNGDGYLDHNDASGRRSVRNGNGERLQQAMQSFDANGDHRLSRDEFVHGPEVLFARGDLDRNGVIDPQETAALRAAVAARRGQ